MFKKDELLKLLREQDITILFTKKDGTERKIICTLASDIIPEEDIPKGTGSKVENEDLISVYDIENQGWRSFYISSIISIEYK